MRTELISIATDTLPLDGAFYLPEAEPCGAVMLFHGNTMNFYVGAPRFLPPRLTQIGFACLAFNVRIIQLRNFRPAPAVPAMWRSCPSAITSTSAGRIG